MGRWVRDGQRIRRRPIRRRGRGAGRFRSGFFAVEVGGDVAGVGGGHGAVRVDAEDEAGGEPPCVRRQHALVHGGENFAGTLRVVGERTKGADQERDGHGGGHAFAADIADDERARRRLAEGMNWKKSPPTSPAGL